MTTRMETSNGQRANLIEYRTSYDGVQIATVQFDGDDHYEEVLAADIHEVAPATSPEQQVEQWVHEQGLDAIAIAREIAALDTTQRAAVHAALYIEAVRNAVDLDSHERDNIVEAFITALGN